MKEITALIQTNRSANWKEQRLPILPIICYVAILAASKLFSSSNFDYFGATNAFAKNPRPFWHDKATISYRRIRYHDVALVKRWREKPVQTARRTAFLVSYWRFRSCCFLYLPSVMTIKSINKGTLATKK